MNILFHLLLLIITPAVFGDTTVFEAVLGGSESEFAYSIDQTTDGGYIVAGQTDSFGNGSSLQPDMWIIKLDAHGNTEWEKTFGERDKGDGAQAVQQTSDGGYIIAGTTSSYGEGYPQIWVIKLNEDGTTSWANIYEGAIVSTAQAIQQTLDGGYIVAGKGEENILKLDHTGNKEWGKKYGWVYNTITQTTDGGYIAAGDSIYQQLEWDYIPSLSLIKLDENGDIEWHNPLGDDFLGSAYSIQQTADGGYIIAGEKAVLKSEFEYSHYLLILKLDTNGNPEWEYRGGEFSGAESVVQTVDNGFIVAGNTTDENHGLDFFIVKLDENGNETWAKTYGSSTGWEYASSIRQTTDGGYVVAGQTDSEGAGRYDIWVLKLDETGTGPGPVGIFSSGDHQKGFSLFQNHPNPFNNATSFCFSLAMSDDITLKIYNILGNELETIVSGHYPAGEYQIGWNAEGLSSGVYFYRLQAGDTAKTMTFILQK